MVQIMCRWILVVVALMLLLRLPPAAAAEAAEGYGKVRKVLLHQVDKKGRHTLSPSLYDRDAYQAHLRKHPEEVSAIRFDVHWQARLPARIPLRLRVEVRTARHPKPLVLEREIEPKPWYNRWSSLHLDGEAFRESGGVIAWRASLLQGDRLVGEQKSFLW
jgi:hypothetical protein